MIEAIRAAWNSIRDRKQAYTYVFRSPSGATVLRDLANFCRATTPPVGADRDETMRLVGRTEVYHRIMQFTRLTDDELFKVFTEGKYPIVKHEDDE